MLQFFRRRGIRGPSRSSPKRRPTRPTVEQLEERDLLSVYTPSQIRQAYGFTAAVGDGSGQTIAIVDAYADPNIFSDLNSFDQYFGITPGVSSSSFLSVATPQGTPSTDASWAMEISLDVEWAHAIAPGAHILLVEAADSNFMNLLSAVQYAAAQPNVSVVSMSWGGGEFAGENTFDSYFTTPAGHPGVTFVASAGDNGSTNYPAASPNVLSVGGTTLNISSSGTYQSETAWSGSGGGLSPYEPEPGYQRSVQSSGVRSTPDVAYNGDPNTGYYVYDSVPYGGITGWWQVGGTSAGAPQWAALIAIANEDRVAAGEATLDGPSQTLPALYGLPSSDFHDVTSGSNNGYSAGVGYDNVTGRGSPIANLVIQGLVSYGSTSGTPGGGTSGGGTSGGTSGGGTSSGGGSTGGTTGGGSTGGGTTGGGTGTGHGGHHHPKRHGHNAHRHAFVAAVGAPLNPLALPEQDGSSSDSVQMPAAVVGQLTGTTSPALLGSNTTPAARPVALVGEQSADTGPAPLLVSQLDKAGTNPGLPTNLIVAAKPPSSRSALPAGVVLSGEDEEVLTTAAAPCFQEEGLVVEHFEREQLLAPPLDESARARAKPALAAALAATLALYWKPFTEETASQQAVPDKDEEPAQ